MNRDDIISMAREAGIGQTGPWFSCIDEELERFAKLVAAAALEHQAEPVAWQDTSNPKELVAAEDWENIDPAWHWMYRPLYAVPQPSAQGGRSE
jgi:hypothetical protein